MVKISKPSGMEISRSLEINGFKGYKKLKMEKVRDLEILKWLCAGVSFRTFSICFGTMPNKALGLGFLFSDFPTVKVGDTFY